MMKVRCLKERENTAILEGKTYFLDITNAFGDSDGDWYAPVYDDKGTQLASSMKLSRFERIE